MKAYVVVNVGRFPPGPTTLNVEDPVVVKVELVTPEKSRADAYMAAHPVAIEKIATEIGEFNCLCQRGVYEAEFEIPEISQELFRPKPPTPPTNRPVIIANNILMIKT